MKGCRQLSDDEINAVVSSFKGKYAQRDRAIFVLGIKTGFRISEILSLQVKDVFQNGQIVDRLTVAKRNMKKKVESRTVILHPAAKKELEAWLLESGNNPDRFLFTSQKGGAISRIHAWRVLNKAYEINEMTGKLGTHCMRKTFANKVHERLNHDLLKTQKALGHKNINSTVSYLNVDEGEIEDAVLGI